MSRVQRITNPIPIDESGSIVSMKSNQNLEGNRISKTEIQAERAAVCGVYCQSDKLKINIFFK